MSTRKQQREAGLTTIVVRSENCFQCGESKDAIRESQRKGGEHQLYCAIVDAEGECLQDFPAHRFVERRTVDLRKASA